MCNTKKDSLIVVDVDFKRLFAIGEQVEPDPLADIIVVILD